MKNTSWPTITWFVYFRPCGTTRWHVHRFGPTSHPHNRRTKALNPRMHPTNPKQRGPGETSNQNWDAFFYWETLNMYGKHNLQHLLFQWTLPNPSNNVKSGGNHSTPTYLQWSSFACGSKHAWKIHDFDAQSFAEHNRIGLSSDIGL